MWTLLIKDNLANQLTSVYQIVRIKLPDCFIGFLYRKYLVKFLYLSSFLRTDFFRYLIMRKLSLSNFVILISLI